MNKLGIWAIAIATAFVIGILSANPVAEAVGGWKEAVADLQDQINSIPVLEPQIVTRTNSMVFAPQGTGMFETRCGTGEFELQIKDYSLSPPTARLPPIGVTLEFIDEPTGKGNIGGDLIIGHSVTVSDINEFTTATTITLAIMCVVIP